MNYCSITVYLRYTIEFWAILEQKRSIIASLALPGSDLSSHKMGMRWFHWTTPPAAGLQPSPPLILAPVFCQPEIASHFSAILDEMKIFS